MEPGVPAPWTRGQRRCAGPLDAGFSGAAARVPRPQRRKDHRGPGTLVQEFLQQVLSGIASGGIYASLALALVLIYNAMGLVNFAQGEMAMLATFLAFTLIDHGMTYWISLPITILVAFGSGIVSQRVLIPP